MRIDNYKLKGIDGLEGATIPEAVASGYLTLVADEEVTGSAVTSVTLDRDLLGESLLFDKEDELVLVSDVSNGTGSGSALYAFVNNNQINTNYYHQLLQVDGTGVSAGRGNNVEIMAVSAGTKSLSITQIKLTNDEYLTIQGETTRKYGESGILLTNDYCSSTFTMTSVTQLDIVASVASAIGIGSRFQLYRVRRKPKGLLIKDIVVESAVTQVDLTGLDIQKGELYELVYTHTNTVGATVDLYANDVLTPTNYWYENLFVDSTSVAGSRANLADIGHASANKTTLIKIYLKLTNDGHFVRIVNTSRNIGSGIIIQDTCSTSTTTFSSITTLNIKATTTNGIGIGSRIQLYKVAEKVDEVIVSGSAVTQVDFTGLDIGKGNEYLLVSDFANTVDAYASLFINDNNTPANYITQILTADGTVVSGSRQDRATLGFIESAFKTFVISKIKLANSGYYNLQSSKIRRQGTNDLHLWKMNASSEFAVSSITKLSAVCETINGIGIGSRFELYKLI